MFSILSAALSNMLFLMLHLENAGSFPKPLTAAQEREALEKMKQDVSMNEPIDVDAQGNPLTLSEIIFTDDTIVDDIDKKLKLERLRQAVAGIEDQREKLIIVRRYGLDGRMPLTQREIAKQLNISRSYVSRIEKKVLHNLRKAFDGD